MVPSVVRRCWTQIGTLLEVIPNEESVVVLALAALVMLTRACHDQSEVGHPITAVLNDFEHNLRVVKTDVFFPEGVLLE